MQQGARTRAYYQHGGHSDPQPTEGANMKPYYFNYRVGNNVHAGEFWSSGKQYVEAMIKRVHPDAYRIVVWRA